MSTNANISEPQSLRREHNIVSQEEWFAARKALLKKEKELTRLRDQLSADRRKLPWEKGQEELRFRFTGRQANPCGSIRWAQPTGYLPLHVRSGLAGGLPKLLIRVRPY